VVREADRCPKAERWVIMLKITSIYVSKQTDSQTNLAVGNNKRQGMYAK
jgi:hypothetical protein